MKLPVTIAFHKDETPLSLVARLAIANGYTSLYEFLSCTHVTPGAIRRGEDSALMALSGWSGVPVNDLVNHASLSTTPTWRIANAKFSRKMRPGYRYRFCAECLRSDLEYGKGRPESRPYVRASWGVRTFAACPIHKCTIEEAASSRATEAEFSKFVMDNHKSILAMAPVPASPQSVRIAEYVAARINGVATNAFLDSMEAYVALDLSTNLGHFARTYEAVDESLGVVSDIEVGFEIASEGATAIRDRVARFVHVNKPSYNSYKSFFGRLWIWLDGHKNKDDYRPVINLFQSIAEENFPLGPDDFFLRESGPRKLHSLKSAGAKWGMSPQLARVILEKARIVEKSDLTRAQVIFDAVRADDVLSTEGKEMTLNQISFEWGIPVCRIKGIVKSGFFTSYKPGRRGVPTTITRKDFDEVERKIDGREVPVEELSGWIKVVRASANGRSLVRVLNLMKAGKIEVVRCGGFGIQHLWVRRDELIEKCREPKKVGKLKLAPPVNYRPNARAKRANPS